MRKLNGIHVDIFLIEGALKNNALGFEDIILGERYDRKIIDIMGVYFKAGKFFHVYDKYDEMLYSCEVFEDVHPIIKYLKNSYADWQKDDIMKHLKNQETNDMINDALNNSDE